MNDGYYTQLRGSVGARGFWEWFKRNNKTQKQSFKDQGKPTGETNTWTKKDGSTGVYEYKTTPFARCDTLARVSQRANVGGCAAMTMLSDSNLKCHI
eukprot:COSAG01_NODE_41501_length_450_cov_11.794872_1_plen_96_part_01